MDEEHLEQIRNIDENGISYPPDSDLELENLYDELKEEIDELKNLLNSYYKTQNHQKSREWLTSREVQKYLRISKITLKRYRERSNIRSIELSNHRFLYHIADLKILTNTEHAD